MNFKHLLPLAFGFVLTAPAFAAMHVLDGKTLTVDELWEISKPGETVSVSEDGWKRIKASYKAPIDAATDGRDIYGLTVNYGALKEKKVAGATVEDEPNRSASIKFNERQMRIQAAGMEPFFDDRVSKMAMVIRVNQMAAGFTGMSETAAKAYMEYINNDVNPLIPSRGSEGANDLSMATHIGLALMGEWDVNYKGKRVPAAQVRKELKLADYHPFGMDGISILSNSNVAEAQSVASVKKAEHYLVKLSPVMIATSLEALNGNVSPYLWHTVETKGWPQGHEAAEAVLANLKGSYLWQKDNKRYLQDPLSFRSAGYILAAAQEELRQAKDLLNSAINHTTDNPIVNTELESLTKALIQVMHTSAWRTTQLVDNHRTGLPTYLVANQNKGGDGFANLAQSMSGLYAEAMGLTNSVLGYGVPTSIGIEETFSNVNLTADRLSKAVDVGYDIYSYEILHNAQAMDMRKEGGKKMGEGTGAFLQSYRKAVPFVDKDRVFTPDVNNGVQFLKSFGAN